MLRIGLHPFLLFFLLSFCRFPQFIQNFQWILIYWFVSSVLFIHWSHQIFFHVPRSTTFLSSKFQLNSQVEEFWFGFSTDFNRRAISFHLTFSFRILFIFFSSLIFSLFLFFDELMWQKNIFFGSRLCLTAFCSEPSFYWPLICGRFRFPPILSVRIFLPNFLAFLSPPPFPPCAPLTRVSGLAYVTLEGGGRTEKRFTTRKQGPKGPNGAVLRDNSNLITPSRCVPRPPAFPFNVHFSHVNPP